MPDCGPDLEFDPVLDSGPETVPDCGLDPGGAGRRVVGLLLAAGGGSRYGMPKVLAADGRWLHDAIAALLAGGCTRVLVVLGAAEVDLPAKAQAVPNAAWRTGMASSVTVGLDAVSRTDADVAVLHLVDLPDVTSRVVARVLSHLEPGGLARASYRGAPGHPVAATRAHWADMSRAAAADRGAASYLALAPGLCLVECGDLATGADEDSPRRSRRLSE